MLPHNTRFETGCRVMTSYQCKARFAMRAAMVVGQNNAGHVRYVMDAGSSGEWVYYQSIHQYEFDLRRVRVDMLLVRYVAKSDIKTTKNGTISKHWTQPGSHRVACLEQPASGCRNLCKHQRGNGNSAKTDMQYTVFMQYTSFLSAPLPPFLGLAS